MDSMLLKILNELKDKGIRFAITGGYVIKKSNDERMKDLDIIVHEDDVPLLIETKLGTYQEYHSETELENLFQDRKKYIIVTENCTIDCLIRFFKGFTYKDETKFDIDPDTGFQCMTKERLKLLGSKMRGKYRERYEGL